MRSWQLSELNLSVLNNVKSRLRTKLGSDLLWNLNAFLILGISGVLLNILIGFFYGPVALGIFNQAFSVYIVFSQLSVFGIYLSTLKYTVELEKNPASLNSMVCTALSIVGIIALLASGLCYLLSGFIGSLFESHGAGVAIKTISCGLWFFSMNKVLLAFINGIRQMRAYAIFQALRYILITFFLCLLSLRGAPEETLTASISLSESILFFFLVVYTKQYYRFSLKHLRKWVVLHLKFGLKGFLSGAMAEINTRVDIIMLGFFCSDFLVGIYSLPAMIAEGVMQLSVIVKDNINPLMTKLFLSGDLAKLSMLLLKVKYYFYAVMFFVVLLSVTLYPFALALLFNGQQFSGSITIFTILSLFLFLSSGFLPLNMILTQTGFPGHQTIFILFSMASNIIFNLALIPIFNIYGAAVATGFSWILSVAFLKIYVKKLLALKI